MSTGDLFNLLGRTLGFSFAAGINLYATVAILGHHDPPPLNMPAEIRIQRVIPDAQQD